MKKGASFLGSKTLYYAIVLLIVSFMLFYFSVEIKKDLKNSIECLDDIEINLMLAESIYSPDCFVYYDLELEKYIPGTVDLSKFTQENFDENCFRLFEKDINVGLRDTKIGDTVLDPETRQRLVIVYDEDKQILENMEFNFQKSRC